MKTKPPVWLSLCLISLYAQLGFAQCRLLYRSQDLFLPAEQTVASTLDTANQIVAIESRGALSKYLIVSYAHAKRKLLLKTSLWGFIDNHHAIWRSYQKELFLVRHYDTNWVEYIIQRPIGTRLTAMHGVVMYSRSLDSNIRSTWRDAMTDVPAHYIVR